MKKLLYFAIFLSSYVSAIAQNQNLSGGAVFEGEPFLAVNPNNSQHIVVAWMGFTGGPGLSIKTKASFNGGVSWSTVKVLPHFSASFKSADPSLVFDNAGIVYACYIDYRESPDSGGVYVIKSMDGGLNWVMPSKAIDIFADGSKKPIDRPWMSIDKINNHLYITSKPPSWVAAPNRPYFVASTDAGSSWQTIRYLDTLGFLTGNFIAAPMATNAVSSDGVFYAVYPSYVPSQNVLPGYLLAKSTSDGATFSYSPVLYTSVTGSDTLAKLGYKLLSDPSNPDHLVFVYLLKPSGDLDVFIAESYNAGTSWIAGIRVNDDPVANGKMQDLVWADFDEDGDLALAWRDRRNAAGSGYSTDSDIWGTIRWKDSASFSTNFRIADTLALYNATYLTQNGNDFMCIDLIKDTLNSVWGDVRNGVLNIYFSRKALKDGTTSIQVLSTEDLYSLHVFPNPVDHKLFIEGADILSVSIYNLEGLLLADLAYESGGIDVSSYPKGMLVLHIKTKLGTIVKKVSRL